MALNRSDLRRTESVEVSDQLIVRVCSKQSW